MSHKNNFNVIAIIPVYNEVGRIGNVISKFTNKLVDEVCLILDESTTIIKNEIKKSSLSVDVPITIIENGKRKGIGNAIRQGIDYAIENEFDVIVVMAGNNKDDPREIPRLLYPLKKYDYVQGSRFLSGGVHKNTPLLRVLLIRFYSLIWTVVTGVFCTDVTNGFRSYKVSIFKDNRINIWQNWLTGYELEFYIHYKMLSLRDRVREVPVSKIYPSKKQERYTHINPVKDLLSILSTLFYLALGIRT